ncbi:molybdenum cofactor biosynthesis protein c [Nannochloropsis gaditana]|uniref:cyclic pyranopterin monophosphate synthase n=1 Tax=Nannochloropsis gaditana TaxID=72520 RepID=W7TE04_9STRA|nr:molybdenum cofactor biosynthesis protein c [Nannochloropsis gaditana]
MRPCLSKGAAIRGLCRPAHVTGGVFTQRTEDGMHLALADGPGRSQQYRTFIFPTHAIATASANFTAAASHSVSSSSLPPSSSTASASLSHVDRQGQPTMVDVGGKTISSREAKARCRVVFPRQTMGSVLQYEGRKELMSSKGPVFSTAIVAGVMGAKKTSELIPFCHPLALDDCHLHVRFDEDLNRPNEVLIDCTVRVQGRTGVEMEALTGASMAALCIYDMCKATSHDILIKDLQLLSKSGGKRDVKRREVVTTIPFPPSSLPASRKREKRRKRDGRTRSGETGRLVSWTTQFEGRMEGEGEAGGEGGSPPHPTGPSGLGRNLTLDGGIGGNDGGCCKAKMGRDRGIGITERWRPCVRIPCMARVWGLQTDLLGYRVGGSESKEAGAWCLKQVNTRRKEGREWLAHSLRSKMMANTSRLHVRKIPRQEKGSQGRY